MGVHPEALLLSAVLRTGQHQPLVAQGVSSDIFTMHQDEMRWVERYVAKHGRVPSKETFKLHWPGFTTYKTDDVEHLCDAVKDNFVRASITNLMSESIDVLDRDEVKRAVQMLDRGLRDINLRANGTRDEFDVFANWASTYESVKDRVSKQMKNGMVGIPTGFPTLDEMTAGLQGGWFVVLAARLSQGKTWTGVRMACTAAFAGFRIQVFSLEQSRTQIAMRCHTFASSAYGVSVFKSLDLMRGKGFDLREYRRFLEGLQIKGNLLVDDTRSLGPCTPELVARVIEQRQPDIVFIDYLSLMSLPTRDWQGYGSLVNELQQVGQRFDIPVVVMAQVNRLGTGKEPPRTEHTADSDQIPRAADLQVTMVQKSKHVMKMSLEKNRHGPNGVSWFCRFSPNTGQFDEINGDEAADQIDKDKEIP